MPLEVMDCRGEVVGVVVGAWHNYAEKKYYHLVARTKEGCNLEEIFPLEDLEEIAATRLNVKNMLGRINKDTLYAKLREWWHAEGAEPAEFEPYLALRTLVFVQRAYGNLKPMPKVAADYYFLCPRGERRQQKGRLFFDFDIGELDAFAQHLPFPALIGKIIAYPEVVLDVAGVGETLLLGGGFNDMGGRNHTHATVLPLRSGGAETKLELPLLVFAQKGELVALEVDEEKGVLDLAGGRVFTGGIIYTYC